MLLVLAATTGCARKVPSSTPPPLGASKKLDIAASGHLLVTAKIEGRPYVLVLDTGASITSLSSAAARELGVVPTGSMKINTSIEAPTGTLRKLAISGVDHANLPIVIVDHPEAPSNAAGILGLDVLARHDIVVDFADNEFGVYPAGTLVSSRADLVSIDYGKNGLILMDVVIDGRNAVPAMLDLGAPVSILNRRAGAMIGARGTATHIAPHTGEFKLVPVRALVRDVGTFKRLGFANRPAIVLGADAFEDRVLAISYRDRVAFVSPELRR